MMTELNSPAHDWLQVEETGEKGFFRHRFHDRHVGNTFIRSIHGGVSAGLTEVCSEMALKQELGQQVDCIVVSNCINYLRATKDHDIFAKTSIVRISRRAAFIEVTCWQDNEQEPITKGTCTLQIMATQ